MKRHRPFRFAKLTSLHQLSPLWRIDAVFYHHYSILEMLHLIAFYYDFRSIPLSRFFAILRFCRYHIIQRSRLTVTVHAHFGIWMTIIIQDLKFWTRNINRLTFDFFG